MDVSMSPPLVSVGLISAALTCVIQVVELQIGAGTAIFKRVKFITAVVTSLWFWWALGKWWEDNGRLRYMRQRVSGLTFNSQKLIFLCKQVWASGLLCTQCSQKMGPLSLRFLSENRRFFSQSLSLWKEMSFTNFSESHVSCKGPVPSTSWLAWLEVWLRLRARFFSSRWKFQTVSGGIRSGFALRRV